MKRMRQRSRMPVAVAAAIGVALAGYVSVRALSPNTGQGSTTAACAQSAVSTDFWAQMSSSSPYKKWAMQNPGGVTRVNDYRAGGARPTPLTAFEAALLDAVDMGCAGAGSTTTVTTTVGTTTAPPPTTTAPTTTAPPPPPPPPPSPCTKTASLTGLDTNPGTTALPYRTVTKLVNSLGPAETGCIDGGTYNESPIDIRTGGSPGFPIILESTPGQRATLHGRFVDWDTANDWTFRDLNFDSSGYNASPVIDGDRITLSGSDITSHHTGTGAVATGICLILGDSTSFSGVALDPVIDGNRIHDCGNLPSDNRGHGLYDEATSRAQITNNYIYDNADRGIQLYPDAQGGTITNNVLDSNGENVQFGGQATGASSNNTIRNNVISNANIRSNVESYYSPGEPVGTGNVVDGNCIFGPIGAQVGFTVSNTITADPLYVNRAAKDFRLQPGSPCVGLGPP